MANNEKPKVKLSNSLKGEIIIYTDLNQIKIGDGTTSVINLPFKDTEYTDIEIESLWNAR